MKYKKILVTGASDIIQRHHLLFHSMSEYIDQFDYLAIDNLSNSKALKNFAKSIYKRLPFLPEVRASTLRKNPQNYIKRSIRCEQKITKLTNTPELIFHLYGMFSPLWIKRNIPYVSYLDYTMALAKKNWSLWAPFLSEQSYKTWLDCEQKSYHHARHIFTKSNCVKTSLIEDYGLTPDRITVVYSSGQFLEPYEGEKKFGSLQIIFNGSDFERKGGNIVIDAFDKIRQKIPDAKLIIVGKTTTIAENRNGIVNLGVVSPEKLKQLFLNTDLVVSPAYCEPLGLFLVEATNYGVPCIVSKQDGMPDLIEHQYNGLVIQKPSYTQIAEETINLLSDIDRLKQMSHNARNRCKDHFTWDRVSNKIISKLANI